MRCLQAVLSTVETSTPYTGWWQDFGNKTLQTDRAAFLADVEASSIEHDSHQTTTPISTPTRHEQWRTMRNIFSNFLAYLQDVFEQPETTANVRSRT